MKKKTKKKLDLSKLKISNMSEMVDKKMQAATIPPRTFWCTTSF